MQLRPLDQISSSQFALGRCRGWVRKRLTTQLGKFAGVGIYAKDTRRVREGYEEDTKYTRRIPEGYEEDTWMVRGGYEEDTRRIQGGYEEGTLRIRYEEDTRRVH